MSRTLVIVTAVALVLVASSFALLQHSSAQETEKKAGPCEGICKEVTGLEKSLDKLLEDTIAALHEGNLSKAQVRTLVDSTTKKMDAKMIRLGDLYIDAHRNHCACQ